MRYAVDRDAETPGEGARLGTSAARFGVLVAYDNAVNARRAMLLLDELAGRLGSKIEFHRELWRFDIIGLLSSQGGAPQVVTTSNLLLVAANAEPDLPDSVKQWLEAWATKRRPGAAALVSVLAYEDSNLTQHSLVQTFIKTLAERTGVEYFAGKTTRPAGQPKTGFSILQASRADRSSTGQSQFGT